LRRPCLQGRDAIRPHIDQQGTIMRIHHTLTLIGVAALSLPAFAADPSNTSEASAGTLANVHIVASAQYKLQPDEFRGVQGSYALDDGRILRVSGANHKLYAEMGRGNVEIVAVAKNVFASRDRDLELRFDQIPFASIVTLSQTAR
jgi:hypothetical protein